MRKTFGGRRKGSKASFVLGAKVTTRHILGTAILIYLSILALTGTVLFTREDIHPDHHHQGLQTSTRKVPVTNTKSAPLPAHVDPVLGANAGKSYPKDTIAYAISITACAKEAAIEQGAAVLGHSIHLSSKRNPNSGSKYDYKLYAFVHPTATSCAMEDLPRLGYEIMVLETPINSTEIKDDWFREHVVRSGCCGDKEFLKLYSYTLLNHEIVVHLDTDSLILQPLDDLFDSMLDSHSPARDKLPVMFGHKPPETINAFYTFDYNMMNKGNKHPGVQGGFLVVRPDMDVFSEYLGIILEGNFKHTGRKGWGDGYGGYYGSQQIQGLCSYFYGQLHPNTSVELNRCHYNQMVDGPKNKEGECRTFEKECEDCRKAPLSQVKSAHFTICQKPWWCTPFGGNLDSTRLCKQLHRKWFRIRDDLERSWTEMPNVNPKELPERSTFNRDVSFGFCKSNSRRGYIKLKVPSGLAP